MSWTEYRPGPLGAGQASSSQAGKTGWPLPSISVKFTDEGINENAAAVRGQYVASRRNVGIRPGGASGKCLITALRAKMYSSPKSKNRFCVNRYL